MCPLHSRPTPCPKCAAHVAWLRAVIEAVHAGTTADAIRGER